jgi:peptidyl-prolyl cis-trans isomerase B (cyclophilin B)
MFEQKNFIIDGNNYYLDFTISVKDYEEIVGGNVNSPVRYKVYFDNDGNIISFTRSMSYYYYDVVLVEDNTTITINKAGSVEKINAPDNAEDFAIRPKAEEIDISTIENLDGFEKTNDISDYVLLKIKAGDYSGEILIRLFPDVAPITVSNFQMLVSTSFYNGLTMHRIIKDFVIQGGDPKGDGTGGSETDIFGEFASNGFTNNLSHKRGVVSMARSNDPNSASSQFFICHYDALHLNDNYAAFGFVVYGMDTVDYIANLETDSSDAPLTTVTIEEAIFVKNQT